MYKKLFSFQNHKLLNVLNIAILRVLILSNRLTYKNSSFELNYIFHIICLLKYQMLRAK
jgi:hypothetical protein